ncbi:putative PEP-binding protein [Streptomyces sp. NPDC127098]|uniref:putative PEP-binding protein n=1 Tax=Streptomyces sp. NPDC127098 TaxID=3347137 RepID=UPI00364D4388
MTAPTTPLRFPGQAAAPGIGLGRLLRTDRQVDLDAAPAGDPESLVGEALEAVAARLFALAETLRGQGRAEQADIMGVGGQIAGDPELRAGAVARAAAGLPPARAIDETVTQYADAMAALDDPVLAERAADIRQVGRRALAWLAGERAPGTDVPGEPLVLAAREIGAADLLEPGRTVGAAVTLAGGPNSHAAIVARSLGIPLLLAADPGLLDLPDGVEVLVDGGTNGTPAATAHPVAEERAAALAALATARERRAALAAGRHLPAETTDGHRMVLRANVATADDARAALAANAEGVGLLRTELPFLDAAAWPSREQHVAAVAPVLRALAGRPVVVRTLDFADDKLPPFLAATNPGGRIGRGLPLMLAAPDAFADQFRALLAAAGTAGADLRIMIPMVASPQELAACRALLDRATAELGVAAPPLGVMVELSEAVAAVDELARDAAFLSIGSNDLTCQLLGVDRRDPAATPALAAHPTVLRAIGEVAEAGRRHGRPVSVCGDAAAHPLLVPLLVGLGCDVLSVAPGALDAVRARVRGLRHADCVALAAEARALDSVEQVWKLVERAAPPLD